MLPTKRQIKAPNCFAKDQDTETARSKRKNRDSETVLPKIRDSEAEGNAQKTRLQDIYNPDEILRDPNIWSDYSPPLMNPLYPGLPYCF